MVVVDYGYTAGSQAGGSGCLVQFVGLQVGVGHRVGGHYVGSMFAASPEHS